MQMKFRMNPLCLAVGAAFGIAAAPPALALDPATIASGIAGGTITQVFMSGATAQDTGFRTAVAKLCVTGTLDWYSAGNWNAFACTANTTTFPGICAGAGCTQNLLIHKNSDKGSGNGVLPLVGTGTAIPFIQFSNSATIAAACTTTSTQAAITSTLCTTTVPSFTKRTCDTNTTPGIPPNTLNNQLSIGGLSDVEPPFFSTSDVSSVHAVNANHVAFGFLVSKGLYRALQRAQGLDFSTTTTVSSPDGLVTFPARDSEANMPSLTRDTISSLFSGIVFDWGTLKTTTGASITTAFCTGATCDVPTVAPTDTTVYLARRVPSSGTQKASELFLYAGTTGGGDDGLGFTPANGFPAFCNPSALGMLSGNAPAADASAGCLTNPFTGANPFVGSGTGDVLTCVTNHNTAARWAIGIASAEQPYVNGNGWRFVKVDGFSPSLINVYVGNYHHWVGQALNTPTGYGPAASTVQAKTRDRIFSDLTTPTTLKAINSTQTQVWGAGALLAIPSNFTPPVPATTQAALECNPVNVWDRAVGGTLDNCKYPIDFANPATFAPNPIQLK